MSRQSSPDCRINVVTMLLKLLDEEEDNVTSAEKEMVQAEEVLTCHQERMANLIQALNALGFDACDPVARNMQHAQHD